MGSNYPMDIANGDEHFPFLRRWANQVYWRLLNCILHGNHYSTQLVGYLQYIKG